ncbi:MAG: InlB B-repeat-containing protein [Anaerovoracaceae bacterium]
MRKQIVSPLPTARKDTEVSTMSNCKKKAKPALIRRILSCLLSAVLMVTLMPVVDFGNANKAYAAGTYDWENKVWIGDTPVNLDNLTGEGWDFKNGGAGHYILELKDGFTCSNATKISDSNDKAIIRIESLENVTIKVSGNVVIGTAGAENNAPNGTNTYGIYAPDTKLAIESFGEGTGTLNVYSNSNAIWCKELRVENAKLNCLAYRTAIKVVGTGYIDKEENGNMLVRSGAQIFAKTVNGSGFYPESFRTLNAISDAFGVNYKENGGAAILVSGSFTVEDSTVTGENTCNKLPDWPGNMFEDYKKYFNRARFCSTIFSRGTMKVSGATAYVSGRLTNNETDFGDETDGGYLCSKIGAVVAEKMIVDEGGTIEGFILNAGNSNYAQGLRSFVQKIAYPALEAVKISLTGEGVLRNGNSDGSVTPEPPTYVDDDAYDLVEYTDSRDLYPSHLEISVSKSSTLYLKKYSDASYYWSFQKNFNIYSASHLLESPELDLRNFANHTMIDNVKVLSGDWTIIPPGETAVDYYIESGSSKIKPQDGMEYLGGKAHIAEGATLRIEGDGIAKSWDVSPLNSTDTTGGTVWFVNGTVENASADMTNEVYVLGGNINFNLKDLQIVRNGDGTQIYKDVYIMSPCTDPLTSIHTGEETIIPTESYYYPIGESRNLAVWTINDLPIKYVTVTPEGGDPYNLIPGGSVEGLGNEYHRLVIAERYREFVPNPNYQFFRNPDESVAMNAAGCINTYENRLDSAFYGPYLIGSATDLDSSLRAEWSYQNENDEKVVVGGNSLTYTAGDLSDIVNKRTYTCTVYEKAADGSEKAIGSYNARVCVMRWEQPDRIKTALGREATFTVNPSEEIDWAGFLRTLKWQVNKGTGWEDIPDSKADSYTVTITEENANYQYRRVISGSTIGNFNTGEAGIYVEFASQALSVTVAPEITSQPQSIKIHALDTAKHALTLSANDVEGYQWQKNVDGTFVDMEGETSSTLEVDAENTGTYRCIVSNRFGNTVSQEASVTILPAPACGTPTGGNAAFGAKAQLYADFSNVSGDGSVQIKWQYSTDDGATWIDVVSMDPSDNISMFYVAIEFGYKPIDPPGAATIISSRIDGASMTINKTTEDMDGWKVRCVLSDAFGVYYSNIVELSIDMPEYTVSFDIGEHGTAPEAIRNVKHGSAISAPAEPKADGYIFGGWYTDQECSDGSKFDFSAPVTQDITLYAKWTKYYPYVPPEQNPIVENDDNAKTNADLSGTTSTSDGTTTATIDQATGEEIVNKAVENESEEVVIDATSNTTTAADSTVIAQVGIPTATLEAIAEKTNADVTVKTDVAEVTMDNATAGAVAKQAAGDTVQLIVEKVAETADKVEFQLKVVCSNGTVIRDFKGGNVAVTVAVPDAMAEKKIVCVYIDDSGRMHRVKGQKNANGTYTFMTGHFSVYALMTAEEADAAIAAQKDEIRNIDITLRSQQVKMKNGKKAIKLTWACDSDADFDGVEIYRSTKRYSGYGKKPIYTTTKDAYYNTAIKKGTKYYYKVRGYVEVEGEKIYTDWSTKAWRTVK